MTMISRIAVVTLIAHAVACGDSLDAPPDGPQRADAALPQDASFDAARPDARSVDAMPDATPIVDLDHDGHPADADCDDNDPTVWQNLPYNFRDADGDGHTVSAAGMICSGASLPPGYSLVPGEPDCDDADPAVFTQVTGFLDADGDGVGDGIAMPFCTAGGLPAGFAVNGGDCGPADPTRWQLLPYGFRDADGDSAAVPEIGMVCSGATLPAGYLDAAPVGRPLDCDDTNPDVSVALTIFADGDHDGFGAGPGQLACTNGSAPAGFSTSGTDCDDGDATVWVSLVYTAVDFDGDRVTAPALGTRCTAGVLVPPYYATPIGNDCDDTNPDVFIALTIFADVDRDGFGAGPGQLACTNGSPPDGFSTSGTDCDDGDASRWVLLTYQGIDADGDGVTVPASGQRCTDGTLPPPFRATQNGHDCDDNDPTLTHLAVRYPDQDGDGVGAPPRQVLCIGTTTPAGFAVGGYDDDDTDPTVIETDDDDELELLLLGG
jgi:hypothetical protein